MGRQSPEPLVRRLTNNRDRNNEDARPPPRTGSTPVKKKDSRPIEALKQLFCGGMAGCVAKSVTAPLSRLTILYQIHPMVTTKENRPKFSMTIRGGIAKIVERGGILSLWKVSLFFAAFQILKFSFSCPIRA